MSKWIREKFDACDLKSVFMAAGFLSIGAFLFFYFTDIHSRLRQDDQEEFTGRTLGRIVLVVPVDIVKHSRWTGTEIRVDSYRIQYSYQVDGREFQSTDIIPKTKRNERYLVTVLNRKPDDTFEIHFDLKGPHRSVLIESEVQTIESRR